MKCLFYYIVDYALEMVNINELQKLYYASRRTAFGNWEGMIRTRPLLVTLSPTPHVFLQFDYSYPKTSKINDNKLDLSRMIGWGNPQLFHILRESRRHIFADCTYRIVPKEFYQIMIIMVYSRAHDYYTPVFYVLLQDKSEKTYKIAFEHIVKAIGGSIDVATFTGDFELSLVKAAKTVFGDKDTDYVLCWFHLKQAIRKKAIAIGLSPEVVNVLVGSEDIDAPGATRGLVNLLTVIDPTEIESFGIPYIRKEMEQFEEKFKDLLDEFWKYFKKTWMTLYKVEDWNVARLKKRIEDGETNVIINRTNNPLERYNRRLNGLFPNPHPSVPELVNALRKEAQHQQDKLNRILEKTYVPTERRSVIFTSIPTKYLLYKESLSPPTIVTTTPDVADSESSKKRKPTAAAEVQIQPITKGNGVTEERDERSKKRQRQNSINHNDSCNKQQQKGKPQQKKPERNNINKVTKTPTKKGSSRVQTTLTKSSSKPKSNKSKPTGCKPKASQSIFKANAGNNKSRPPAKQKQPSTHTMHTRSDKRVSKKNPNYV